jgi:hypothetical protein
MIPIKIDTAGISGEFGLTDTQINEMISSVIFGLTQKVADRWKLIASHELHSTRSTYINSIIVGDEGPYVGFVKLSSTSPIVNMIENGQSAFDLKDGFGKSGKIRIKKGGGWYLSIPLRFGAAGSLGENPVFTGGTLPKPIQKVIDKQPIGKSLSINQIPEQYQVPDVRRIAAGANGVYAEYQHKTSKFTGLTKTKLAGSNKHTQYHTFRRVSDKSDANSWIHPGVQAKHFADKALKGVDLFQAIDELVDNYLAGLGFK